MKRIEKSIILSVFTILALATSISCSDKLDTQEGQLNTGDLDYTNTDDMIDPVIGAYYEFASRGWEEPLLLGVRGDDVNAGLGLVQLPLQNSPGFNRDFIPLADNLVDASIADHQPHRGL